MSQNSCCVPGCATRRKDGVALHRFPNPETKVDKFKTWVFNIFGEIAKIDDITIYDNRRVCHAHFQDIHKYGRNKLCNLATPVLHMPGLSLTASNKTGQDTAVVQKETLTTNTDGGPKTQTTADADSSLSDVSAPGCSKTATPCEFRLPSTAQTCETLTNNKSSSGSINPATDEHAPPISIADEGDKESNIDDDAELLTLSDLEAEYLEEALSEEEIESTVTEEISKEADTTLVDEASKTERTINVTGDANLLIYDTENQPIKNIICTTCFSGGRTLYPLVQRKYISMVLQFFSNVQFTEEDMICWECDAFINKMRKFKHQVMVAQSRFREFTEGDKVVITKSLSCMKTTEITHISISSDFTEEDVKSEDEQDILENDGHSDCTEAMETSPIRINQRTYRSGHGAVKMVTDDTVSTLSTIPHRESEKQNETKVVKTYYNKPKQKYNVIHIPKLREKAKLLPQLNSLKEVCKKKVMTEEEMKQFRRDMRSTWKSGEHSCHKCIITFQLVAQLNEHNKKHDPKAGDYACRVCEQRFSDAGPRDAHYHKHFVVFECASCGLKTGGRNAMLGHFERLHREQRRACRDCGEVFMLFQEFRQHRLVAHGPKMTCDYCGKIFRERGNFSKHLNLHKKEVLCKNKCQICGMMFRFKIQLKNHLLEAHDIKKGVPDAAKLLRLGQCEQEKETYCVVCKKQFKTWSCYQGHLSSLKHMKLTNAPMENVMRQCEDCGRFFTNVTRLRVHRKSYHLYEKCVCDLCNKEFISKALLIQHLKNSNRHKTDRVRNLMCEHCGKSFYDVPALRGHLYTHNTEQRFACDICGKAFTNPQSKSKHRRRVHNIGWKNFINSPLQIGGAT